MRGLAKVLAVLATMAAVIVIAPIAQAAFPGQNGKIAFSNIEDNSIETINPDGTARTTLITDGGGPAWSPSGDKIAFTSARDGSLDIYVANADGSGQTNVTNNEASDGDAAWSADGTKITFASDRDGNWEIYTMNADGSNQTRITNDPDREDSPAWSPLGGKIAFFNRTELRIYTMNVDGSGGTLLPTAYRIGTPESCGATKADHAPHWSPDGRQLVFIHEEYGYPNCVQPEYYGVHTINADGTGERSLYEDLAFFINPIWSPDGTRILVEDSSNELFLIDLDGNRLNTLATVPPSPCCADWQPFTGPQRSNYKNAAQFCKAEREVLGDSRFRQKYGGGENAHGKCVSAK